MVKSIFFQDWTGLARTAIGAVSTYLALIVLLRVAGQRTLAKWNAFDLIVTVALGSTFAMGVLSKEVTVAQAVLGFVMLVGLQFCVAWLLVRVRTLNTLVNPPPKLVLFEGEFCRETMRKNRVTEADVCAALRGHGCAALDQAAAVILEKDGSFSVIQELKTGSHSALRDVQGFSDHHP